MRDLEKLIGWHRMAIIYMLSGIGGKIKFEMISNFANHDKCI
jgi:hypothetical protein